MVAVTEASLQIRRLQKIKGGSYTLSLPKDWIEKRGVNRGSRIALLEAGDGSLHLYPVDWKERAGASEVALNVKSAHSLKPLEYCINTYYMQGAEKVVVVSKDAIPVDFKRGIKLLRMNLTGMEVVEEDAKRIAFQVLLDPARYSLNDLIRKTSVFSLQLLKDAVKALSEEKFTSATEVLDRSLEALRHYRMIIRQISLSSQNPLVAKEVGVRNCQECVTFALLARDMNRIVYHASNIAREVVALEGKGKFPPEIIRHVLVLSELAGEMQKAAVEAFLSKNIRMAITSIQNMDRVRETERLLLKVVMGKVKDVDLAISLSTIARSLRRMAGYSVAIADDALNRALTPLERPEVELDS